MIAQSSSRLRRALNVAGVSLLAACSQPEPAAPPPDRTPEPGTTEPVPYDVVAGGAMSPLGVVERVFGEEAEWAPIAAQLGVRRRGDVTGTAPVLFAAVEAPTGGHRLRFDRVYARTNRDGQAELVAAYTVEEPGPGCGARPVLTRPFQAIHIQRHGDLPVQFVGRRQAVPCE